MKRAIIFPIVAIVLLAVMYGPYLLLLLLVIPIGYFFIKQQEKAAPPRVNYSNMEEVEAKYGEPEDVVVLDATKANELQGVILFYPSQDKMIVVGEEMRLSDLEGVAAKNLATPYIVDEYAVVGLDAVILGRLGVDIVAGTDNDVVGRVDGIVVVAIHFQGTATLTKQQFALAVEGSLVVILRTAAVFKAVGALQYDEGTLGTQQVEGGTVGIDNGGIA